MKRPYNIWSPHLGRWLKHEDIGRHWPDLVDEDPGSDQKPRPNPLTKSSWKSGQCFDYYMQYKNNTLYPGYVVVVGYDAEDGRFGCGVQRYGRSSQQIKQAEDAALLQCQAAVSNNPDSCKTVAIAQ